MRRHFKVADDAQIIMRGTAEDRFLERYWEYRKTDDVAGEVALLNVSLFIGPNYSHFLDVPRSDLLYNRKRQLLCLAELSRAGVSVAPLSCPLGLLVRIPARPNTIVPCRRELPDWLTRAQEGKKAIRRVLQIQDEIGPGLSLLLIGGAQYMPDVAGRFASFTLIDSKPFKQSLYRKLFRAEGSRRRWADSWTLHEQPIDDIMQRNVEDYASWVDGFASD